MTSVKSLGDHGIIFEITVESFRERAELLVTWALPEGTIFSHKQLETTLKRFGPVPKFHRAGKLFEFELLIKNEDTYQIVFLLKPTAVALVHIISSNTFEHTICYKVISAELARGILGLSNSDIIIPDEANYVKFEIGGYPEQTRVLNLPLN